MQADPNIQAPLNMQNYNRYSYVLNNPMSMTDPSGYFFKKLFRAIAKVPILNAAVQAVLAFYCQVCLVAYNAASTYAVTGSLKAAFTSAVVSIASPGGASLGSIVSTGVIGGLASKVQGGNFGHGFFSAGLGAALGGRIKTGNAYANVIVSAVVGGTVSKLTGGKFSNGAQTWAFSAAMAQDWGKQESNENNLPDFSSMTNEEKVQWIYANKDKLQIEIAEGVTIDTSNMDIEGQWIDNVGPSYCEPSGCGEGAQGMPAFFIDETIILLKGAVIPQSGASEAYINPMTGNITFTNLGDTSAIEQLIFVLGHEGAHTLGIDMGGSSLIHPNANYYGIRALINFRKLKGK